MCLNNIFLQNFSSVMHFLSCLFLFCYFSNKDTKWVSQVFRRNKWKDGSKLFDLEKDCEFSLCIPQRDFPPGSENRHRISDGMEKSRRVIIIVSR